MPVWKQFFVLLLLAGLSAGGYFVYLDFFDPPAAEEASTGATHAITVETAVAERQRIARTVEAVGTTRASRSVEIVPLADGRVVAVNFRTGEHVNKGDVLVKLDDDIERANVAEAEAQLVEKQQAVERTRQLRQTNAVAVAQFEQVTAEYKVAEAALDRARRRLADREIRAPFEGVVGLTNVDPGARVQEGEAITTIDDLSQVEVEFSLPETLFGEISQGQAIAARAAAFKDQGFAGKVSAIGTRVDSVSRAFRVRAVIPNPEGALPAGMFMFLTLTLSETNAITVPEEAVIAQAAETYVYVVDDGHAARRVVKTGQRQKGRIAIVSGLSEGEVVVTQGMQRLRDNSPVKVANLPATAAVAQRADGT